MTEIERLLEVPDQSDPDYGNLQMTPEAIEAGRHRKVVGGRWDDIGKRQLEFLLGRGLDKSMNLLDVGCGSFRAGRHFIDYLKPKRYYGIDASQSLIAAGYDHELSEEARRKLPVSNLRATDRFNVDFGVEFDMAIANSVFTHVSLNHVRLCLHRVAQALKPGGQFYATFLEQPPDFPIDGVMGRPGKRRFYERNVYWYYRTDLEWAASDLPLRAEYIGDWGHPRDQRMIAYIRD